MSAAKRAFLHIVRKKGKTLLLLSTTLLVCILLFSSVLFYNAINQTIRGLKRSYQSSFHIAY
jgi:hypothetical protein